MDSMKGTEASLSDYYSAVQLRQDRWSTLRETCETLVRLSDEKPAKSKTSFAKAQALLESLAPIEMYWAFPGRAAFQHLRKLLENRNFDDLAFFFRVQSQL